jgi:transposase
VRSAGTPPHPVVVPRAPVERALSDADWERLRPLLPPQKPSIGRPFLDHRMVLSGILAVVGTGASWREMPAEYGKWETAYKRYRLWCAEGRWQRLLEALGPDTVAGPHTADAGP